MRWATRAKAGLEHGWAIPLDRCSDCKRDGPTKNRHVNTARSRPNRQLVSRMFARAAPSTTT